MVPIGTFLHFFLRMGLGSVRVVSLVWLIVTAEASGHIPKFQVDPSVGGNSQLVATDSANQKKSDASALFEVLKTNLKALHGIVQLRHC